eukprot:jgi/Undpi1/4584/HiC_scaffold_18.g07938.m1
MECGMYIEQVVACLLQEVTDLDVAGALRVYVLADLAALGGCFAGLLQTTTTDGNTLRSIAKIQTFEDGQRWLNRLQLEQQNKPKYPGDNTYSNLHVVQAGDKVLLKCRVCSVSKPPIKDALIDGKDMFSASLRTDILSSHFKKRNDGKSPHDVGVATERDAQQMANKREEIHLRAREHVVTLMRIAAHIAQQELPISAFASQVDLVRDCGGNTFPDKTFENDKGAWELLRALEGVALKELHEKLGQSEFIGLQIDESTDRADSSNLFMAVHFEENFRPGVAMLGLKPVHTINPNKNEVQHSTGERIKEVVCDVLKATPGLNLGKLMGFASDGASCMVGKNIGTATLLAKDNPHLLRTHCVAHRGSLAAGSTCAAVPLTVETDKLVTDVNRYLCKSSLRKANLKLVAANMGEKFVSPQAYIKIRFLSRGTAVAALVKSYLVLLKFFYEEGGGAAMRKSLRRFSFCLVPPITLKWFSQSFEFKQLLRRLGGAGGEAALREKLRQQPQGIEVPFPDAPEIKVRISAADVEQVESAAKNLAVNALDELKERFPDVGILERCAVFDPQRFPTNEQDICDYGADDITALGEHYGKQHGDVPPVVDRDDLCREWYHAKSIMFDVRLKPEIKRKVAAIEAKSAAISAANNPDEDEAAEERSVGLPLKKGERARKNRSEMFIDLYAEFWGKVRSSNEGARFPNLYKLVKIYII